MTQKEGEWMSEITFEDVKAYCEPRCLSIVGNELLYELQKYSGQKWIPCSERLPEDGKRVLITGYYNGKLITDVAIHEYGCWDCCDDSSYDDKDVTAWMPLPDPYKP